MLLKTWRRRAGLTNRQLAEKLAVGEEAVRRYQLNHDHPECQVPSRPVMLRIVEVTEGKVKPNDFYLSRSAAA